MPRCLYSVAFVCAIFRMAFAMPDVNEVVRSAASGFSAGLAVVDKGLEEAVILDVMTNDKHIRQTRGIIGEASTDDALAFYLNRNGQTVWRAMTPRIGPQGIDHLFVKYTESGMPIDFYLAESKWGKSQLGDTNDGLQMGRQWTRERLEKIGLRYSEKLANGKGITCRRIQNGTVPNAEMSVMIKGKNGGLIERVFWRESSKGKWFYSGVQQELREAQRAARLLGRLYEAGAKGRIGFRRSVYHWDVSGNDLRLRIDTVNKEDMFSKGKIENGRMIAFKGYANKGLPNKAVDDLYKSLKRNAEYRDWKPSELKSWVRNVAGSYKKVAVQSQFRVLRVGTSTAGGASVVAAGIDAAIQTINKGSVDWAQVAETGGKAFVAVGAGEASGYGMLKAGVGRRWLRGGAKAGAMAATLSAFDYYQVYKGNMSWEDAHANTAISGISMGAGAVTGVAIMALPTVMGATASTGTAIASLSGAAATNATLAFYGGGSVAAGGFGVAGGAIVVSGGVLIVAVGVAAAATWGYGIYKEKKAWDQVEEWGHWLHENLRDVQTLRGSNPLS